MENIDFYLCGFKKNSPMNEFVVMLFHTTILSSIHLNTLVGLGHDTILCGFSELAKMADRNDTPKFVFAHLMIPHRPYLFGPNGELLNPSTPILEDKIENWDRDHYLGQLEFANKKIREIIEELTKTDTPPVIIIQSDHGFRDWETNIEKEFMLANFNNFKAYYFPGKGRNMEFETTTAVNSFRVFFNLYFDAEYELLEDRIFSPMLEKPYQFTDVTELLISK